MKIRFSWLLWAQLLLAFPAAAAAQTANVNHVAVTLVPEVQSVQPGNPFWVAIRFEIEDSWHIYWKNPGDSGLAVTLKWNLPEGFSAGDIRWPYPEVIPQEPLVTYAYEKEAMLLVPMQISDEVRPGGDALIRAHAQWLVCQRICLPGEADLELTLPVRDQVPQPDEKWSEAFSSARFQLPIDLPGFRMQASREGKHLRLSVFSPAWSSSRPGQIYFFAVEPKIVEYAARQPNRKLKEGWSVDMDVSELATGMPSRLRGVLVSENGWRGKNSERALRVDVPVEAAPSGEGGLAEAAENLPIAIIFAFLGGLLLNLMPCVLPVLSLKVLGFVDQAHKHRPGIFLHGILFSSGVLVSFWSLAALMLLLRQLGQEIGWGFQLQSPGFVILLIAVFFLFTLNLFGMFEIGVSLTKAGKHTKSGKTGAFLSGVLATVVATPCTAPFMGSAFGFTLTQSVPVSLLVFTALGAGMAFPYLLFSASPGLLKFVPQPGPWMIGLKRFFGVLLGATVVWLLWVLSYQVSDQVLITELAGLSLIGGAAWLYGRGRSRVLAILLLAGGLALPLASVHLVGSELLSQVKDRTRILDWEPFSQERLDLLRSEGKPVLIDFTAAWCLSCQVNERIALKNSQVKEKLEQYGVVLLKADWTSRDEHITQALRQYGRNSIPLYVLYGTDGDQPQFLPEILTPGIVLDALEEAFYKQDQEKTRE